MIGRSSIDPVCIDLFASHVKATVIAWSFLNLCPKERNSKFATVFNSLFDGLFMPT